MAKPTCGTRPIRFASLWGVVCILACGGCAPYRFGNQAIFNTQIRTVHVPIVENETFRHDLGRRLTEALVREIELRTPYKVTGDTNADSVLRCQFVNESKAVLAETDTDDPRALDVSISVQATWTGRNGEPMMQNSLLSGIDAVSFGQETRLVPEAGQSVQSALQDSIEDLASRIVSQMELRW